MVITSIVVYITMLLLNSKQKFADRVFVRGF